MIDAIITEVYTVMSELHTEINASISNLHTKINVNIFDLRIEINEISTTQDTIITRLTHIEEHLTSVEDVIRELGS